MYRKKREKVGKTKDVTKLIFVFVCFNINVLKILFKLIHLETDLEEVLEQKLHN